MRRRRRSERWRGAREMKRVRGQDEVSGFIPDVQSFACCQLKSSGEHFSCHSAGVVPRFSVCQSVRPLTAVVLIAAARHVELISSPQQVNSYITGSEEKTHKKSPRPHHPPKN